VICHEQYVAQTKNKFSKRWSAHRSNWNRPNCKNDKIEEVGLSRRYALFHGKTDRQTDRQCLYILHGQRKDPTSSKSSDHDVNKPAPIHEAYIVTFGEQPNQIFTPCLSAKINGTTSLTHKLIFTA